MRWAGHAGHRGGGKKLAPGFGGTTWKVKVKFNLEQATKAQKGSKGIVLLFL
jgi:hypothetical protein